MTGPSYEREPRPYEQGAAPYEQGPAPYGAGPYEPDPYGADPYRPDPRASRRPPRPPGVDAARLWGGGLATAAIAALMAFLGVLIARGVFGIELLAPEREGTIGDTTTGVYVLMAGIGALVATLILQILALLTPQPLSFFSWVVGLVTLVFAVTPFTTGADIASQVATGLINLCIGLTILTLLPRSAYGALRSGGRGPA
ncbi:DUF6069 family protein [Actinomadura fibrosa]|uniref:DUF6069 family protein n=1 Tax=Actinomadura fibrosa TaxID=111802 RepID=A0ABW2XTN1_9ACTN|nr:DUF6069 family protein [Actinomadura fibrosa]